MDGYPSIPDIVHAMCYVLVSYRDGKLCTDAGSMARYVFTVQRMCRLVGAMVRVANSPDGDDGGFE